MLHQLKIINRSINEHPLAKLNKLRSWKRVLKWQLSQKLYPTNIIYKFIENSKLYVEKGMTGATGNIYFGLKDFEEMGFLLHILKEEDLFFDLGANVGVYSVLASVNAGATSIALEPVKATFEKLCLNIKINNAENKIVPLLAGVSDKNGELAFTNNFDTENRVTKDKDSVNATIVPVVTLDSLAQDYGMPLFIKMDIEGYESYALEGGKSVLANQDLKAVLIEIMGSSLRYGIPNEKIISQLKEYQFEAFRYNPRTKDFTPIFNQYPDDVLFIRDLDFVKRRVEDSRRYRILNFSI